MGGDAQTAENAHLLGLLDEVNDLRSRLACCNEATYWDRPYQERLTAVRGMCDLATDGMTPKPEGAAEPVSQQYLAAISFAADVAHAEARWQTELAMRAADDMRERAKHRYTAERATLVEDALRAHREVCLPAGQVQP